MRRSSLLGLLLALLAALLAGCASTPRPGSPGGAAPSATPAHAGRDGAEANPPPNLADVPDAEPRVEPIRPSGPNKPYEVLGQSYTPVAADRPFEERGLASWYGRKFHGRYTANGEVYDMYAMTAAHRTLPIPSYVRVRNPANGREVVLRINDRGPFVGGRIIDLSYTAALKLDLLRGVAPVELVRLTHDEIRSGAWRRAGNTAFAATAGPPAPASTTRAATAPSLAPTGAATAATPAPAPSPPPTTASAPSAAVASPVEPPAELTGTPLAAAMPSVPLLAGTTETAPPAMDNIANNERAPRRDASGFWVQLGAFAKREGALEMQQRVASAVEWVSPLLAIFSERSLHRVQAGPYPSRQEAQGAAQRLREALQLVPTVIERR